MNRLCKQFSFLGHVASLGLIWLFATRPTGIGLAGACLVLSALALAVTLWQFTTLLRSYGNVFSRVRVLVALVWGGSLSLCALAVGPGMLMRVLAVTSLAFWCYVLWRYRVNTTRFDKVGSGPLRADTWVSPPAEALEPGDVLCTSGRVANWLYQSTGHTEDVIPYEGRLMLFSSWFETGACLNELGRICKPSDRNHYYVLRRRVPLTDEQKRKMEGEAKKMLEENRAFAERLKAKRAGMRPFLRDFMEKRWPATGYDWVGSWNGRIADDHWTCTGVHLTLMRRCGISVPNLGVGLFGLGTGIGDFLNTEDLASDRGLRRLTLADKEEFERRVTTA